MSEREHESDPESTADSESKRSRFSELLNKGLEKGLEIGKVEFEKGVVSLQKSLGLGSRPSVVPEGEANVNGGERKVEIGWHPVAGFAGKWFAESTGLGKMITENINKYPDPTQHWGILVGDYCHQLWMDENFDVIYINEKFKRDEWHTFEVGKTRFNDQALKETGDMVIHNMREAKAAYNLISNNCQNFAVNMLDAIQLGAHMKFATAFAVYQNATGKGRIKDLFDDQPEDKEELEAEKPAMVHQDTLHNAQKVMDEETTKLDSHDTARPN